MDVKAIGYKPAFTGYVDKSVNKLVDKAVKYAIEGTAKYEDGKLTAENFQQIVERGNKVKETFNNMVKNAHPKTKLYIKETLRFIHKNSTTQEYHQFELSNSVLKRSTNYKLDALELFWYKDKSSPLAPLMYLEEFSKELKMMQIDAKKVDASLLVDFGVDLCRNAKSHTSKIHKWFNNRKALKAQKFAEEIGEDANAIAEEYKNACDEGIKIANDKKVHNQILKKIKKNKKENKKLSKNYLK